MFKKVSIVLLRSSKKIPIEKASKHTQTRHTCTLINEVISITIKDKELLINPYPPPPFRIQTHTLNFFTTPSALLRRFVLLAGTRPEQSCKLLVSTPTVDILNHAGTKACVHASVESINESQISAVCIISSVYKPLLSIIIIVVVERRV